MARRPVVEFWYEFASTYSYLSAMRIEASGGGAGVGMLWRPFLLGPIFAAQGLDDLALHLFPDKGRYMWRDMEREAAGSGFRSTGPMPFRRTACWRRASRFSGRIAAGRRPSRGASSSAEFGEGRDIAEPAVIQEVLDRLGLDGRAARRRGRGRRPTSCVSTNRRGGKARAASSARRPSSPRMARCSGATTASRQALAWALATPRTNVPV